MLINKTSLVQVIYIITLEYQTLKQIESSLFA